MKLNAVDLKMKLNRRCCVKVGTLYPGWKMSKALGKSTHRS